MVDNNEVIKFLTKKLKNAKRRYEKASQKMKEIGCPHNGPEFLPGEEEWGWRQYYAEQCCSRFAGCIALLKLEGE